MVLSRLNNLFNRNKTISNIFFKIFGMLLGFLFSILIGRLLTIETFAEYQILLQSNNIFVMFAMFSFPESILATYDYNRGMNKDVYILAKYWPIIVLFGFLFFVEIDTPIILILLGGFCHVYIRFLSSIIIISDKAWIANLLDNVLYYIFLALLLMSFNGFSSISLLNITLIIFVSRLFVLFVVYHRSGIKIPKEEDLEIKNLITRLIEKDGYNFITKVFIVFIPVIPISFLAHFNQLEYVAYFGVALTISSSIAFLIPAYTNARLSRLRAFMLAGNIKAAKDEIFRSSMYLGLFGCFALLGFFYFGRTILSLWGDQYKDGYFITLILLTGQLFNLLGGMSGSLFYIAKKEKEGAFISLLLLVVYLSMFLLQGDSKPEYYAWNYAVVMIFYAVLKYREVLKITT